jgi:hypothetical protein
MAYTFDDGQWGHVDDQIDDLPSFHHTRKRVGFGDGVTLQYCLGEVTLYSRMAESKVKWPYNFVFLLQIGPQGGYYWVWVADLPSLFQFLKLIDASLHGNIAAYLDSTWFKQMVSTLHDLGLMTYDRGLNVNVSDGE